MHINWATKNCVDTHLTRNNEIGVNAVQINMAKPLTSTTLKLHKALCSLFQSDTDGKGVSKCRLLSQQTRRLDPMLFQCWSSAVGGGPILKQHWVKSSHMLGSTQVSVYTHPSPIIIFSPADHGTFSKTADQSQAYYNT